MKLRIRRNRKRTHTRTLWKKREALPQRAAGPFSREIAMSTDRDNTKMLETLEELVSIKSIAERGDKDHPFGEGPAKALEYMLEQASAMGFRTVNKGIYGYAEIGEGEELIGILAHLDTVEAGKGWNYPPFEATVEEERIYGRGTIDDKGPAVASLFAMKDILDRGVPGKRIRLILGQTEEDGDWDDISAYLENEEAPDCGFTPDGDFPAIYCENGIMIARISMPLENSGLEYACAGTAPNVVPDICNVRTAGGTYEGHGKMSHGCAPWLGKNAISDAMRRAAEAEGAEKLPFPAIYLRHIADKHHGEGLGIDFSDNGTRLSVNPGIIRSQDGLLTMDMDIRFPISVTSDQVVAGMREALGPYGGLGLTVEKSFEMPPVYMEKDGPVISRLLAAYRQVTGDQGDPLAIGGGTYARSMKNIVAFGPNFPGHENREHNSDEYLLLEDFYKLREIYRLALQNLLDTQDR